jgi:hypothetical protein
LKIGFCILKAYRFMIKDADIDGDGKINYEGNI